MKQRPLKPSPKAKTKKLKFWQLGDNIPFANIRAFLCAILGSHVNTILNIKSTDEDYAKSKRFFFEKQNPKYQPDVLGFEMICKYCGLNYQRIYKELQLRVREIEEERRKRDERFQTLGGRKKKARRKKRLAANRNKSSDESREVLRCAKK